MNIKSSFPWAVLSTALVLTGCGGSSNGGGGVDRQLVETNAAKISLRPLKGAQASAFAKHFKNGIYTSSINLYSGCDNCMEDVASPQASSADSDFSTTNTQEVGVDEADRIKYDGEYLYMAARGYYDGPGQIDNSANKDYVKVMQRQADTSISDVADITLPEETDYVRGIYLQNDKLAVIGGPDVYAAEPGLAIDVWHPVDLKVHLSVYDVASPTTPELNQYLSYDGYLISSRRIDNKLYLVSSYSPTIEGLAYGASTDAEKQANYDKVQATDINSLMPKVTLGDNTVRNLVDPEDCYIPEDASSADGYDSIVTLTTVDLNAPNDIQSVCINAVTHDIYASTNAVYLMGITNEEKSVIHKFDFGQSLDYVGAGVLDGMMGWSKPSFRLSEYEGRLRVVTTSWNSGAPIHKLHVLNATAQDKKLNVLSELPNDNRTEAIGKPNEDIYAVRFYKDRAYIVTYERIDPLYVIGLENDADPYIAGALEIPGYSAYLHPINDNLLLGIGQQIDPNNLPQNGGDNTANTNPIEEGAKVSLFDVSDPANPIEVGGVVYANGYTPAEWQHHALTYLPVSDSEFRFALPLSTHEQDAQTGYWRSYESLRTLQVNVTGNGAELVEQPPVMAVDENEELYIGSYDDRSILHDEQVYYIHGNKVYQGTWGN